MRKLIAGLKISIDGKADGADGPADWIEAWSDDYGLTPQIDACVLGGGMYPGYEWYWTSILNEPEKPIGDHVPTAGEIEWARFAAKTPHYILSRTLAEATFPNTTIPRSFDAVSDLKQRPGKDIYLIGGVSAAAACMGAGLVDELRVIVYPLIAGEGKSAFPNSPRGLQLQDVEELGNGRARLAYVLSRT
jgi:dihydrofolate reductase